ncbi:MAG: heat-shock protein Hsp70 [Spirochaetaceae bacterium]|nr:MAG: heat-shock protein Hsp70 [Spirochaetaceae bacterium]
MIVIGIDLGTTNSAVGYVDGDEARIIPNDRGARLTPSVVSITAAGEILVGDSAKNQAVVHADRTVSHVKRCMGEATHLHLGSRRLLPEEVSAEILRKLKKDAEIYLGNEVGKAVITVPANFGEAQRKATIEAGRLAGLEVLRILNEPTAAALSYAWRHPEAKRLTVYDLGGGTFDVTCLEKTDTEYLVRSSCGENKLGGLDFDSLLRDELLKHFEKEYGFVASTDSIVLQQLSEMVERAKIELSSRESAAIALPFMGTGGQPLHLSYEARRDIFDQLIAPMIERSLKLTVQAIKESGFSRVDALVLAGGSSRIPLVQRRLGELLGLKPSGGVNPDEVVALGAALYGNMLADEQRHSGNGRRGLRDVTSYTLGVEIDAGKVAHLVRRNTPLPVDARRIVTTVADMQESVEVHVLQGEGPDVTSNRSLGRFMLSGITPARRGAARIEVSFLIDEDGIVRVSAVDTKSGRREHVTVRPVKDEQQDDAHSISDRLESLSRRIRSEMKDLVVPQELLEDIQDLLLYSDKVRSSGEESALREAEIALESIIEELISIREDIEDSSREHA